MNATEWTTKSIHDLPDSSFAYIEPGGSKDAIGKTIPRSLRHLPYKTATGTVEPFLLTKAIEDVSKAALPVITKNRIAKKLAEVAATQPKPPCDCGDEHCSGTMKLKAALIEKYITGDGPYVVHAESGKVLGTHPTRGEAEAQLRAIEANKHSKAAGSVEWPEVPSPGARGTRGEKAPNQKDAETVSPAPVDDDQLLKDYEAFCATIKSSDPGSRVQSLIFDSRLYNAKDARGWANDHGFKSSPAKSVGDVFHIQQSEGPYDELRPIALTEGVQAVIGMPVQSIEAVQRAFAATVGNTFKSADLAKAQCEVLAEDSAGTVVFRVKVADRAYHFAVQGDEAAHLPFYASKQAYVPIVKMENEQRYTLSVVYPASAQDNPKPDFHGDIMSQEELEKSAWGFMAKGTDRIGLMHRPGTQGAGRVVESYIWRGPEWKMQDAGGKEQSVSPGDWVMGIVWEPAAWEQIKQGGITGLSLQGAARKEAF